MNGYLFVIFLVNTIVACVYILLERYWRGKKTKAVLCGLFIIAAPIVGPVYLLLAEFFANTVFSRRGDLAEEEIGFIKERMKLIVADDVEKDIDIVPIDESLRISDTMDRRQAFLSILKRDNPDMYMAGIQDAMKRGDGEVIHYAAYYITDTISKYKDNERRLRAACDKDENNVDVLLSYLHFTGGILQKHVFAQPEQAMYVANYDNYMEKLYLLAPDKFDGAMAGQLFELLREQNRDDRLGQWVSRLELIADKDLEAAKLALGYYYEKADTEKFYALIQRIKASDLDFDSELTEWIRFFKN